MARNKSFRQKLLKKLKKQGFEPESPAPMFIKKSLPKIIKTEEEKKQEALQKYLVMRDIAAFLGHEVPKAELDSFLFTLEPVKQNEGDLQIDNQEPLFRLVVSRENPIYSGTSRDGQYVFRQQILKRYGARCAVCGLKVVELLDAAHLCPYKEGGTNDARNGIPMCVLHHRAFDAGLFGIEPVTLRICTKPNGPDAKDLNLSHTDLKHLPVLPHKTALEWSWERF